MRGYAVGTSFGLTILILPYHPAADNIRSTYQRGVSNGVELQHCHGDDGEGDIGTIWPGEGFGLLNLEGKIHPSFIPPFPGRSGGLISPVSIVDPIPYRGEVVSGESIAEIRRLDRRFVQADMAG
jgi:hypothetical protein